MATKGADPGDIDAEPTAGEEERSDIIVVSLLEERDQLFCFESVSRGLERESGPVATQS